MTGARIEARVRNPGRTRLLSRNVNVSERHDLLGHVRTDVWHGGANISVSFARSDRLQLEHIRARLRIFGLDGYGILAPSNTVLGNDSPLRNTETFEAGIDQHAF